MGILTITAIETGCFGACTNEEVPDKYYDLLVKQEELKDGLEVYKPKSTVYYASQIKCPLCKCRFPEEERDIIQKMFNAGGEKTLSSIISDYNQETENVNKIDNIKELEVKYNKIKEMVKIAEDNRFYKHTCTRNEICKRTANQDVYIDLCYESPKDFKKQLKIDFEKLKTDENYRNEYLSNKKIAYENNIKRMKRKQIEKEYIDEFEEMTFKKEKNMYEMTTRNIKDAYRRHEEFEARKDKMMIRSEFQASNEWYKEKGCFKYSATKKKLLNFVENLTGQNINDNVIMQDSEYEEFQKFILKRDPDYSEFL